MANPETPHDKNAPEELKREKICDDGSHITHSYQGEGTDKSTGKDDKKASDDPKQEKISDQGDGLEKLQVSVVKLEVVSSNKENDGGPDMQELTPQEETTPMHKVPDDGFNWRKYGQKNVKGDEFVRSYYRCTHTFCQVKRQVERSHDGQITDMVYLGQHIHPPINNPGAVNPPASPTIKKFDKSPSSNVKEKLSEVKISEYPQVSLITSSEMEIIRKNCDTKCVLPQNDKVRDNNSPVSKKKKRGPDSANATAGDMPSSVARTVVHTVSEVDIVHDGHRWRKYGQKMVKGNTNPRSYYRCSWIGCPARKLVERASNDQKVVVTTYEGQHLHNSALQRTVSAHNMDGLNASTSDHCEDSKKQSSDADSPHNIILEATTTTTTSTSIAQKINVDNNRKAKKRAGIGHVVGFKMSVLPGPEIQPDPDEQLNNDGASPGLCTDVTDEHSHAQLHANNAAAVGN